MIITANIYYANHPVTPAHRLDEWLRLQVIPGMLRYGIAPLGYAEDVPPLQAFVTWGRWLAWCPCRGAERVWEEGWWMCCSCWNAWAGHRFVRTVFPEERLLIERLLDARLLPNRNWAPGESVDELARENVEHGIAVT